MEYFFQIIFLFLTWFSNQIYSNEPFFEFTQSFHEVNKGYSIRVAKIWDDFDNGLYLSDLNIYNAANDGTLVLDDIIEFSSIKLRRPNGTFADVEYRVVITNQGKVRMISKFNLDKIVNSAGNTNSFFKNVDEFAATFDQAGTVSQALRNQAFELYKQGKWSELETLFKNNNLNKSGTTIWPPANGGYNIVDMPIKAGEKFDRYGFAFGNTPNGNPNLGGNFTSPIENGTIFSFEQRALNKAQNEYDFYFEIEVLQDLPFSSQKADVIPWFGQVGGGKQSMWNIPSNPNSAQGYSYTLSELAEMGLIKITIKSSPSGNYTNLVNTIIQQL